MQITYQDYNLVPWNRKSNFNSFLALVGGFIFPPLLWWVLFNLFTGNVYYRHKGRDGYLMVWPKINKIAGVLITILQLLLIGAALTI